VASVTLRSLRARTTIGATLIVALVLVLGAIAFFQVLSASVHGASERAAETRAEEIADRIEDASPRVLDDLDDDIAQLVDSAGAVIATSEEAEGVRLPVSDSPQTMSIDGESMLVVSKEVDDERTLLLGVSIEDDTETLGTVATLLVIAVPLVIALVGITTWLVVGRALRPVTRIRQEVDGITAERLHQRVPVPDSGDEIADLATTMNGMLDRLDTSAQAQRRFVSDASHELRSPLATIRQHAELAQSHPEVTSVSELAGIVHDEGLRLQGLVDALLLLTRLDEGAGRMLEPVDLDDLALAEATRLRQAGHDVDGSGIGAARVMGDPRLLGQLVRNLADNAARHATAKIALTVTQHDGRAVLCVADDGAGIAPADRERVFERFVRLDEARAREAGGSGLGLAIAHGIATSSSGTISIDESRWGGARFVVVLPSAT
jgi:signal transduction histidine kinase